MKRLDEYLNEHPERTFSWLARKVGCSNHTAGKAARGLRVSAHTQRRIDFAAGEPLVYGWAPDADESPKANEPAAPVESRCEPVHETL